MLTEPLVQQLAALRLHGMASALEQQMRRTRRAPSCSFEDRLGLMIQHEITERAGYRLAQRLRWARCRCPPASRTSTPARRAGSIRRSSPGSPISAGSAST